MPADEMTYAEWLGDRTQSGCDRALTDAEQTAFDRWYRDDAPAARRVARRIVGPEAAEDAVHGAITRIMYATVTDPAEPPIEYDTLRWRMPAAVRALAINMVARKRHTPPEDQQRSRMKTLVSERRVPERLLVRDFEPFTEEPAKAAGTGATYVSPPASAYRGPCGPQPDPVVMGQELDFILSQAIRELPFMQENVIVCWLEVPSREITSEVLDIAPKTFDTHFARAKRRLREVLLARRWMVPDDPNHPEGARHLSAWTEVFRDMELDRLDRQRAARIGTLETVTVEKKKAA